MDNTWKIIGYLVPVICVFLTVGLTFWVTRRMERMKVSLQRTLKRFDLLSVERFKTLDQVDDRLVDVQQAIFENYMSLHKQPPTNGMAELETFRKASLELSRAKVKSEMYFDSEFNEQFGKLVGEVQTVLMHAGDLRSGYLNEQQYADVFGKLNATMMSTGDKIPEFRRLMARRIQEDLD